jgi:hypothetical protein
MVKFNPDKKTFRKFGIVTAAAFLVYKVWMRVAFILSWVNTRIILFVLFYLILTPIGLVLRLFKVDLLERRKQAETYWKIKEKAGFNPLNYERRF